MSNKDAPHVEVLQGTLDLMVLQTLSAMGPLHGYAIAARLEQISSGALQLNMGTLYPALMRLEQRGMLRGTWGTTETNRRARFYSLTAAGTGRARIGTEVLGTDGRHHPGALEQRGLTMTSLLRVVREWMQRVQGSLRGGRTDEDLAEELRAHAELAAEHARRTRAPNPHQDLRTRRTVDAALESLRDQRGLPWLDALKSDAIFGWRQILRHRTASTIAVLSLGLSIGATVDGIPVRGRHPAPAPADRRSGSPLLRCSSRSWIRRRPDTREDYDYPTFRQSATFWRTKPIVMVVGMSHPVEAIGRQRPERTLPSAIPLRQRLSSVRSAGRQPVDCSVHQTTTSPARILLRSSATTAGRSGLPEIRVSSARRSRSTAIAIEIVGVAPAGFIGTEPGLVPDVFVPATMNTEALNAHGWSWFSLWLRPRPGVEPETIRQMMQAAFDRDQRARLKDFSADTPKLTIEHFLAQRIVLQPAGHGLSPIQKHLATPLVILMGLVVLVLMMACATVGNLLTGQAVARAREMALRVSIGAGRARLIQLVMVESAILALARPHWVPRSPRGRRRRWSA